MSQITGVLFLIAILATTTSYAQTLQELTTQYDAQSPIQRERLKTEQTVDPEAPVLTPAEEQIAEVKEKEEAERKAIDEKIYLNTDYRFFQSLDSTTLEEDALDKAYKQAQASETIKQLAVTNEAVKSEIRTTAPQIKVMSPEEAKAADARRELILKKIASNVATVKLCVRHYRNEKEAFKGTELTLAWEVDATGKVTSARVKATDLENKDIPKCILGALYEWNFNEVVKDQKKASQIEYTYRFTNPAKVAKE